MPDKKTEEKEQKDDPSKNSYIAIVSWWKRIHFSGRVIVCSVLFGFGLVLIGSLVFAINMDDDSNKPDDNLAKEIPTKAPSNVVGPVLMGIGVFIVIVGIVMCLFETQVCRKKSGDSSPLISEGAPDKKDSEAADIPSTSHSHRLGNHKTGASPKRSKGRHVKDKHSKKTASPRSPPITIEAPRNNITSSDESFLTPPNTLNPHPPLQHSNSRDAENQTSSSLMKSFNSSAPSWTQSAEYQTPATSISVDNSMELCKQLKSVSDNTLEVQKVDFNAGFLTPVTLEDEKIQKLSSNIENQKKYESLVEGNYDISANVTNNESPIFESIKEQEKDEVKNTENVENNCALPDQPKLVTNTLEKTYSVDESLKDIVPEQIIDEKKNNLDEDSSLGKEKLFAISGLPVSDNCTVEIGDNETEVASSKEEGNNKNVHVDADVNIIVERTDLESTASSEETVVSSDNILEQQTNDDNLEAVVVPKVDKNMSKICISTIHEKDDKSQLDEIEKEKNPAAAQDCEINDVIEEKH